MDCLHIIEEIYEALKQIKSADVDVLIDDIMKANKIYVIGAGRSGLMLKAFAMRLMHLGLKVYVVGEIVTPAIEKNDLLIVGSSSGETSVLVTLVNKAKNIGSSVALITSSPNSTIATVADTIVHITPQLPSTQPGGTTFEQSLLLLGDCIILKLMNQMDINTNIMKYHANLE